MKEILIIPMLLPSLTLGATTYYVSTTGNAGTSAIGNPYIGKGQTGGIVGYISTFVIYNSDQTSNRTAIENIINNYYSIY